MILRIIFPFLLTFTPLVAIYEPVVINLEFAIDSDKKNWGLMQRKSLPDNYGMLFAQPSEARISLWAFNCYIDLAIAFLDRNGVVQEIASLKAYPEMMDPKRPVLSLKDLPLYPPNDPILQFYSKHGITSKRPCSYALETESSFFKKNKIDIGDHLEWDQKSSHGVFNGPFIN